MKENRSVLLSNGETEQLTLEVVPAIDTVKNVFGEEVEQRFMIGIMRADDLTYEKSSLLGALQSACLRPGCTFP